MSWSLSSLRAAADDARRRIEAEACATAESAEGAARAATKRAKQAVRAVATNAPEPSTAVTEHASQAARDFAKNAAAKAIARLPSSSPLPGPLPSPTKTPSIVPGVNQEGSTAERVRPYVMLGAGFGSGVVSGHLGPGGAIAQRALDAIVDHYGTPQDKFNFGYGQMGSAFVVAAEGATIAGGGGTVEVGSAGAATPVAIPAVAYGAVEMAVAVSHADGASTLMSHGAPAPPSSQAALPSPASQADSGSAPTSSQPATTAPTSSAAATGAPASTSDPAMAAPKPAIKLDHILDGEINKKGKAVGYHWKGSTNPNVRTVPGTRTPLDENGIYAEKVQVYNPSTKTWVTKDTPSTFFPDSYSKADVERAIDEAYANRQSLGGQLWEGKTASGLKVRGAVDSSGTITTAYPIRSK